MRDIVGNKRDAKRNAMELWSFSRRAVMRFAAVAGTALVLSAPSIATAAEPLPVAIKGYDAVAYFTAGKPTRGREDIELVWDDRRYRFASAEHRALFRADPGRYAPQFSDYCAMALSKGAIVEADPENWVVADGKLFIFGKPVGPDLFRKDVAGNLAKAQGNRTLLRKQ